MYKVGIGYDIHRFVPKRKLFLGGVNVPNPSGLLGYSDGDVVMHAVCDALLGAMGEDDIGRHFPVSDPAYKNIRSIKLLEKVRGLLEKKFFLVGNVDVMVIMESPKIADFKVKMRKNIAKALKIDVAQVSIKATTNEGVGGIGRGEAAAAYAVAMIQSRRSL